MTRIMEVTRVGAVSRCMADPQSYRSEIRYGEPTAKRIAEIAMQRLEEARAKDVAIHEANMPAIEANKVVHESIVSLMTNAGIPKSWRERDTKSRAYIPKSKEVEAGYLSDLRNFCVTDDGFAAATLTYENLKRRYEEYASKAESAEKEAVAAREREAAAAIERRKADLDLCRIILSHGLPEMSGWDDVLDALRKKDKRLDLAVAMRLTRGDWSEGYYRVHDAIRRFTIRDDTDKEIINDVLETARDDDFVDGRVFRDCAWNYGRLFEQAEDRQLVADIESALANGAGR